MNSPHFKICLVDALAILAVPVCLILLVVGLRMIADARRRAAALKRARLLLDQKRREDLPPGQN
jgi:hypothetical protein